MVDFHRMIDISAIRVDSLPQPDGPDARVWPILWAHYEPAEAAPPAPAPRKARP